MKGAIQMNWKNRAGAFLLVGVMMCGLVGCNTPMDDSKEVKNVIFMIGDGMGYNAIDAAETLYKKQLKNKLLINYDCVSDGDDLSLR